MGNIRVIDDSKKKLGVSIDGFNVGKISRNRYNRVLDNSIDRIIVNNFEGGEFTGDYNEKNVEIYLVGENIALEGIKCRDIIIHGDIVNLYMHNSLLDNIRFDKGAIVKLEIYDSKVIEDISINYLTIGVDVINSYIKNICINSSDERCMVNVVNSVLCGLNIETTENLEVSLSDSLVIETNIFGLKSITISTDGIYGESILKAFVVANKFEYCGFNRIDNIDFKGLKTLLRKMTIGYLDDKYYNKRKQVIKVKSNSINRYGNNVRSIDGE